MKKVVALGPLLPAVGGAPRSFQVLTEALVTSESRTRVVNTFPALGGRSSRWSHTVRRLWVLTHLLWYALRSPEGVLWYTSPKSCYWFAPAILLLARRARVVVYMYGGDGGAVLQKLPRWRKRAAQRALALCASVYVETDLTASELQEGGVQNARPSGPFRPLPETYDVTKNVGDDLRLIYVGRLLPTKGVEPLIDAVANLAGVGLDIWGSGDDEYVRVLQRKLTNVSNVRLRGVATREAIPSLLADADFCVLLSSHPSEGYPGVVLESFGAGTPILVSNHRSLGAIAKQSGAGMVVEEITPASIRASLREIQRECTAIAVERRLAARKHAAQYQPNYIVRRILRDLVPERSETRASQDDVACG